MGVPQIEINDKMIVGFNKPVLDEELDKLEKIPEQEMDKAA